MTESIAARAAARRVIPAPPGAEAARLAALGQTPRTSAQTGKTAMLRTIHPIAGGLAFALVAAFWTATLAVELGGSVEAVVAVKTAIPWGLALLIPALAAAGGSGFALGRGGGGARLDAKRRRMRAAAANGLLVLVPAALFLAAKAEARDFDAAFVAVQAAELAAGALNLALIGLNMRDGLAMRRRVAAKG